MGEKDLAGEKDVVGPRSAPGEAASTAPGAPGASTAPPETAWRRPYYTILAGQAVSQVGSSAVQFALVWYLAQATGSPAAMGLAGLAAFLPGALLSPVTGIVADRRNRKRVCIASDLAAGAMAAAFALAMGSWGVTVATVIVLLAARSAATSFQSPAMQAMVPQIVPADSLVEAGGMAQAVSSASYVLGPVVGGALFAALPLPTVLLTDLAGALVAAATLARVPVPDHRAPGPRPELHPIRELVDGLSVFWEDRTLTQVIVSLFVFMVFFMPLSSFYPLMTSDYFGLGAFEGSLVEMIWALGMLLAGLVVAKASFGDEVRASFWSTVALGAVCLASGLLPRSFGGWVAFVALCGAMGASATCYNVPIVAYMQRSIAPEKLGRAFSAFQIVSMLSIPVGLAVAAPVAEALGVSAWFSVAGAAILVLGLAMLVLEGRSRRGPGKAERPGAGAAD
ncbi:MFS transporter [Atopobiaceae bacterium HCP3S3_D6]